MNNIEIIFNEIFKNEGDCISIDLTLAKNFLTANKEKNQYLTLNHIEHINYKKYFENEDLYNRFIEATSNLKKFNIECDLFKNKKYKLFLNENIELSIEIFNKLKKSELNGREFISSLPNRIKYPDEWYNFVIKVLDYKLNKNDLIKSLVCSNYRKILECNNEKEIINTLKTIRSKRFENLI